MLTMIIVLTLIGGKSDNNCTKTTSLPMETTYSIPSATTSQWLLHATKRVIQIVMQDGIPNEILPKLDLNYTKVCHTLLPQHFVFEV